MIQVLGHNAINITCQKINAHVVVSRISEQKCVNNARKIHIKMEKRSFALVANWICQSMNSILEQNVVNANEDQDVKHVKGSPAHNGFMTIKNMLGNVNVEIIMRHRGLSWRNLGLSGKREVMMAWLFRNFEKSIIELVTSVAALLRKSITQTPIFLSTMIIRLVESEECCAAIAMPGLDYLRITQNYYSKQLNISNLIKFKFIRF